MGPAAARARAIVLTDKAIALLDAMGSEERAYLRWANAQNPPLSEQPRLS